MKANVEKHVLSFTKPIAWAIAIYTTLKYSNIFKTKTWEDVWLCQSLVTGFRARGGFRVDLGLFFIVILNIQVEHPLKNWTGGKLKASKE